jgi:hypothetical protein
MSLLNRFLDVANDFNKNMRDREVQSVPQQFLGGAVYTDPLTKQTVETPIFNDDSNIVGCIAWLVVAPLAMVVRMFSRRRHHRTTAIPSVPRQHNFVSPAQLPRHKSLFLHEYFDDNEDPFALIGNNMVPREFVEMYERDCDEGNALP